MLGFLPVLNSEEFRKILLSADGGMKKYEQIIRRISLPRCAVNEIFASLKL